MLKPRKFTEEEITSILETLRRVYPELTFDLYKADKRFIRIAESLKEMRVDTIPVSHTHVEYLHLTEAEQLIKS